MTKHYAVDLAERVGSTFVFSFAGAFTSLDAFTSFSGLKATAAAGAAAGLGAVGSLAKGYIAKLRTGTASLAKPAGS